MDNQEENPLTRFSRPILYGTSVVIYGLQAWPSHSLWIIPGTITE
jgi:hypothetical protein